MEQATLEEVVVKNITVSVDEETYRNARRKAAERNTSVSRLVVEFLRSLNTEDQLRAERRHRLEQAFREIDLRADPRVVGRFERSEVYEDAVR